MLTTIPALMALALIHMKTNNLNLAARIEIPSTIFELVNCNPLHVFTKVLTKHLIMWNQI